MLLAMRIDVLALNDVFDLGLAAVLDAFQTANELIAVTKMAVPRFDVRIVGVRRSVNTSHGLRVPVHAAGKRTPDCVVVPAIGFKMPGPLEAALTRPEVRDAVIALRQWAGQGSTMTAACIGTFVMAESGLLDHRQATTTWWLAPLFRKRYPSVALNDSSMIVKSGVRPRFARRARGASVENQSRERRRRGGACGLRRRRDLANAPPAPAACRRQGDPESDVTEWQSTRGLSCEFPNRLRRKSFFAPTEPHSERSELS